jgi:hypothetical protein
MCNMTFYLCFNVENVYLLGYKLNESVSVSNKICNMQLLLTTARMG